MTDPISRLDVYQHPEDIEVQLVGQEMPNQSPQQRNPLFAIPVQVWLLRADGTIMGQRSMPVHSVRYLVASQIATADFYFQPVWANELVGVVVSVNGVLYVREIKSAT